MKRKVECVEDVCPACEKVENIKRTSSFRITPTPQFGLWQEDIAISATYRCANCGEEWEITRVYHSQPNGYGI